jgi:hypothetical protein
MVASPAMAGVSCTDNYSLDVNNKASNYLIPFTPTFKDGPGGAITVSVDTAGTLAATATVATGVTVGGVVAEARVDVSASITASATITIGHSYTRTITSGKYGNARYGSWGYNIAWTRYHNFSNCQSTVVSTGTGKMTTASLGWKYGETTV